jgi:hypothetical protein
MSEQASDMTNAANSHVASCSNPMTSPEIFACFGNVLAATSATFFRGGSMRGGYCSAANEISCEGTESSSVRNIGQPG